MFITLPSANVSSGKITSLTGAALSTSPVVTASGTVVVFATDSVSPAFTPTGSNVTPGPVVINGSSDQFLIVPAANFNAANDITSMSGAFVSTSLSETGLLSNIAYRAVTLTVGSGVIDLRTVPGVFAPGQWTVDDAHAGGILVFTILSLPYNGGQAISDVLIYENNSPTPISTGLTAPGTFSLSGRADGQTYSFTIAARNALGPGPQSTTKTQTPSSPSTTPAGTYPDDPTYNFRGWASLFDYGTAYDFLVDQAGGGTHISVAAAMTSATAGNVVAVRKGVYFESFTMKSGVTLRGYGTERPILSAQQPVPGFVQCGAGDAADIGPAFAVSGSPIFKKTGIAKSSVPVTELLALNIMENNRPISNAQDRADKTHMFDREDEVTFYNPVAGGGNFGLTGVAITSITDPTVINASRYTDAQLLAARIRLFADPNESYLVAVTASNVATNTISVGGGFSVNNDGRKFYAIGNIGFAMVPGTWVYVDRGTTFDLFVYPTNPANITKITMVARTNIISLPNGSPTNMTIQGLQFIGTSGQALYEGAAIVDSFNTNTSTNLLVENCKFTGIENIGQLHFAAIWLARSNNITIQNNSFEYCAAHGVFPTGSTITQDGCLIRRNNFENCGSAGAKAYQTSRYAFLHNRHVHCGFRSHGNLGNVYVAGTDSLWWGNEFTDCQGFLTTKTVNPHAAFNWAPCYSKSRQNRKFEDQGGSGTSFFFNNSSPPVTNVPATSGFMAMDWGFGGKTCYEYNNVGHGISRPDDQLGTVVAQYNLVTYAGFSGTVSGRTLGPADFNGSPGAFDTTNVFDTNLAAIYANYLSGNWKPASAASPLLTMQTFDVATMVNTLKAAFPAVPSGDWNRDCFNNQINYAALKVGADQSISFP